MENWPHSALIYAPIGVLRTPFADSEQAPIQPSGARGQKGEAQLWPRYRPALRDLEGFSHLILLYHCHRAGPARMEVRPFLDQESHGLFAVRAPARPNPIGLSVVRLQAVEGSRLLLLDVDMLDQTPLLDIKPYVPAFDQPRNPVRTGWLRGKDEAADGFKGDQRFAAQGK